MNIRKIINRLKRAKKFFEKLEYSTGAWWLVGKNGWQRAILYDRNFKLLNASKIRLLIEKIKVSWLLAFWYLLKEDELYSILDEKRDGYILYKENIGRE